MTTREEREAEDAYEAENDPAPVPSTPIDDSYVRDPNSDLAKFVPVQSDRAEVEDPVQPFSADTDQALGMFTRFMLHRN